jgi:hypothetical protein
MITGKLLSWVTSRSREVNLEDGYRKQDKHNPYSIRAFAGISSKSKGSDCGRNGVQFMHLNK